MTAVHEAVPGLDTPFSMALLPDGRMLGAERPERLVNVSQDGTMSEPDEGTPLAFAG